MSAVSKSVTPASIAASTTSRVRSASSRPPKLLQPRPTTETSRPLAPRVRYSMLLTLCLGGCAPGIGGTALDFCESLDMTDQDLPKLIEERGCPTCRVPAASACRTASGNTAFRYHTARLLQVPGLTAPEVLVPADRGPGAPWPEPSRPVHCRFGYAWGA